MKVARTDWRLWGVVLVALCASCTGSDAVSTPAAEPTATATPVADEPTAIPTPAPTATPLPERSDDDRIADVLATLETNGAEGLLAWDVLDATVRDDATVAVTLCGWTGETIYDNVYTSLWNDADDAPVEAGTSITSGECLNTHLVDTAFETIREFDLFRIDISADPASFPTDTRAQRLLAEETYPVIEASMRARAEDGIVGVSTGFDGMLPESAVAPVLFRRVDDELPTAEFAACRLVNEDAGLYRSGVLISDPRVGSIDGPHAFDWYQLIRHDGRWQIRDRDGTGFGDCFLNDDWPGEISGWKPGQSWVGL